MYPDRELNELAARKGVIQARIAVRRFECVIAARELAKPVAVIDRGLAAWRRISPWVKLAAAVPGGFLFSKFLQRRKGAAATKRGKLGTVLAALPLILRGVRLVQQVRAAQAATREQPGSPRAASTRG